MSVKAIDSIHFLPDRVILNYGDRHVFQFCRECKKGKHLKCFLSYMYPKLNLTGLSDEVMVHLERRFYFNLSRGPARWAIHAEADEFIRYAEGRFASDRRINLQSLKGEKT